MLLPRELHSGKIRRSLQAAIPRRLERERVLDEGFLLALVS
jgi:hypothetical protein